MSVWNTANSNGRNIRQLENFIQSNIVKVNDYIERADLVDPVITLIGDESVEVALNSVYNDVVLLLLMTKQVMSLMIL